MAIEAIGAAGASATLAVSQEQVQARREAFRELGNALQGGDLQGAQAAFERLLENAPRLRAGVAADASGEDGAGGAAQGPRAQAFRELASALGASDLGAAQAAFGAVQGELERLREARAGESADPSIAPEPPVPLYTPQGGSAAAVLGQGVDLLA